MSNNNLYNNVINLSQIEILNGQTTSSYLDLGKISNRGASQLLRISLPSGFPATTITFETADDIGADTPGTFNPLSAQLADGLTTNPVTVITAGSNQDIALVPYLYVSSRFIRVVSGISVGSNTIINLATQPLIQAPA